MSSYNRTALIGNLTRDPDIAQTKSGTNICELRIGCSTRTREGDDVLFIDVVTWDKTAESCAKCLKKGSEILVDGRLKMSEWEGPDGVKRTKFSVVAHRVVFLDKRLQSKPIEESTKEPGGDKG